MILVSPAMLRYLTDPTPENKAKLKPSDLAARDTFTGETMKLEKVRRGGAEESSMKARNQDEHRDEWTGAEWVARLLRDPALAVECDWSKLDGCDWGRLLAEAPGFGEFFRRAELSGSDWCFFLTNGGPAVFPYADRCDWSKFGGGEWAWLLAKCPEFADRCDWSKLDDDDWKYLLSAQPALSEHRKKVDP